MRLYPFTLVRLSDYLAQRRRKSKTFCYKPQDTRDDNKSKGGFFLIFLKGVLDTSVARVYSDISIRFLFTYSTRIKYPDAREKLMQKRHFLSGATATIFKLPWWYLFCLLFSVVFPIFSFTGSAVKKHLNSIRTAERTLCKWGYFGCLGCPNG